MSYAFLRSLLFQMSPELAHNVSLDMLSAAERLHLLDKFIRKPVGKPVEVMGITFPNAVGLAAGLDKNAEHIDALAALGFGFIEVGTVTPKAQPGNPKPRLFRVVEKEAIINRMGFNNEGVDYLLDQVKASRYRGPLGINVGKNLTTSVENATEDYLIGIRKVYSSATYITVNISSPNTPGLRSLQFGESLNQLLDAIKQEQTVLRSEHGKYVPIAVKIAPDMSEEEIQMVAKALLAHDIDGVIATNTTLARDKVEGYSHAHEAGGLSGRPLRESSTEVIRLLKSEVGDRMPIIGVGGIYDAESAVEKIQAGASLVQIYTGFIYRGPALIKETVEALATVTN